jgi:hypothetical protein
MPVDCRVHRPKPDRPLDEPHAGVLGEAHRNEIAERPQRGGPRLLGLGGEPFE